MTEKKKQKNIKVNYFYNLLYQIFSIIIPLITLPYVSRVLGSAGVGKYSFTNSIVTYFILLGSLGFGYYAQREIAKYQDKKEEQTKVFYEIILARFLSVTVSLAIHIIVILTGVYGDSYSLLMWILTINVIATAFDITFLFQGNEEFGIIAIRNIIVKIIGLILIFVFVRDESHVWIYVLSQSIILILSNLSLWTRLPKLLVKVSFKDLRIKRHFLPTLKLFLPTIAVTIYTVLDKTLIGVMVPGTTVVEGVEKSLADIENGNYNQSEQIVKMSMVIITSLGAVMIPRNSYALSTGDKEAFLNNIKKALTFVFFIGFPIMFGLCAVAFNFAPWFFGDGYEKAPYLMALLSPLVLILGLSNVLGLQYLLPLERDSKYTFAIVSGACVNLVLNLIFIPILQSYGAAIATIIAESIVTFLMLFAAKKDVLNKAFVLSLLKYLFCGAVMFGAVFTTQCFLAPSILHTILLMAEGVIVYFGLLFLLRDAVLFGFVKKIAAFFMKKQKHQ